jgi:pimeloyl-ACP methyl ester carboxylesterase
MKRETRVYQFLLLVVTSCTGHIALCKTGGGYTNAYGTIVSSNDSLINGARVEKVTFCPEGNCPQEQQDALKRYGLLVRYPQAEATILLCHGFMCDKFDMGILRRLFPRGRFNVMSFDFRAHGENKKGQYCTLGREEAYDVMAAAKFLRNHPDLKSKPLYVYGFSMGAVAAIEAQAKDSSLFDAMMLDCPFDSAENVIKRGLSHLKLSLFGYSFDVPGKELLQKYAFHPYVQSLVRTVLKAVANMDSSHIAMRVLPIDPVKTVEKIAVPVMYILCRNDEKVSIPGIKSVFNNTKAAYKSLWITNGRRHFDSFFYCPEKYTEKIRTFLDDALNGTLYTVAKQEIIEDEDDFVGAKERKVL